MFCVGRLPLATASVLVRIDTQRTLHAPRHVDVRPLATDSANQPLDSAVLGNKQRHPQINVCLCCVARLARGSDLLAGPMPNAITDGQHETDLSVSLIFPVHYPISAESRAGALVRSSQKRAARNDAGFVLATAWRKSFQMVVAVE